MEGGGGGKSPRPLHVPPHAPVRVEHLARAEASRAGGSISASFLHVQQQTLGSLGSRTLQSARCSEPQVKKNTALSNSLARIEEALEFTGKRLRPQQVRRAKRPCPTLGIGGNGRPK
eukprot:13531088-Alexandrium_andersonii.AAC.1